MVSTINVSDLSWVLMISRLGRSIQDIQVLVLVAPVLVATPMRTLRLPQIRVIREYV